MPFMKGRAPIRRTSQYLEMGQLVFKDSIRIMTINYNSNHRQSKGAYHFGFWHVPQIQYKNPGVQVLTFKNMTPSPFFQFFFTNGEKITVDVYGKSKEEIFEHIRNTFCKSEELLQEEALQAEKKLNPANFGRKYPQECICEVPGQVPCPAFVPLPKEMRGKHTLLGKDVEDAS